MTAQLKPTRGSIWRLSDLAFRRLTDDEQLAYGDHEWVEWKGRVWFRKFKDSSIGEIFGYQIATFLSLPLQPWVGFYDDSPDSDRSPHERFGILVERWDEMRGEVPMTCVAERAPDLEARALALGVFERYEWGAWLLNGKEMRLIDIERNGPHLNWPPQTSPIGNYGPSTDNALRQCQKAAAEINVSDLFLIHLRSLMSADFRNIIDLSGPEPLVAKSLQAKAIEGFEKRQSELRRIIDHVEPPRHPPRKLTKPRRPPRQRVEIRQTVMHPFHGLLHGTIYVFPAPRLQWQITVDFGTMDQDEQLERWFDRPEYLKRIEHLFKRVARLNPKPFKWARISARSGTVKHLSEEQKNQFVKGIQQVWRVALRDWCECGSEPQSRPALTPR